jgi:hypothetical protein
MSAGIISDQVRAILRKDIRTTGAITPAHRLIMVAMIGKRATTKLEKELKGS